jgi:hypothetical protein
VPAGALIKSDSAANYGIHCVWEVRKTRVAARRAVHNVQGAYASLWDMVGSARTLHITVS